jgi:hypothetical protein
MMGPSCAYREPSASFAASAVKTQAKLTLRTSRPGEYLAFIYTGQYN